MGSHPPPASDASGRGVRVAVIDSGVNLNHPHINRVSGGVCVQTDGTIEPGDCVDQLGHGTAVMAAIQEKAPAADYYAVRVFRTALRTSASNLLAALRWCVEQKMDVVNLSLGTTNPAHAEAFAQMVAQAADAGTVLVAARDVNGQPCYPGCFPGVIGVGLDWDCPRDQYRCEQGVWYASGFPRPAEGIPPRRNVHGISFAVANMSGFVARDWRNIAPCR